MSRNKSELFLRCWHICCPGLPEPTPEYKFNAPRSKHAFDWSWPQHPTVGPLVAVEVDGGRFAYRGGRHAGDGDKHKMNLAAMLGWRCFHFSPGMLENDPFGCCAMVARALGYDIGAMAADERGAD